MGDERDAVTRNYGRGDVLGRLLAEIGAAGGSPARLRAPDLRRLDQLHGGGFAATEAMAAFARLRPGMRVLDAGSGLGGVSRYLADEWDCEVEAVDLTPEFVAAQAELDRLCGLAGRIRVRVASVTALPFADSTFDLVWSHYVAMNVADKAALAAEAFRVLRPGGRLAFAMLALGPAGEPEYPMPWAREREASFLVTPEALRATFEGAGFRIVAERQPPPGAAPTPARMGDEGLAPKTAAMGDDMAAREANSRRAVAEGRLVPLMLLAERPG